MSSADLVLLPEPPAPLALPAAPRLDPVKVYLKGFEGSPRTHDTMRDALERLARAVRRPMGEISWAELRFPHTMAMRAEILKADYKPRTVRVTLTALRGLLKTCWRLELMSYDDYARATDWPLLRFAALPAGRSLSADEVGAVAAVVRGKKGLYGRFTRALFALLFSTGARIEEVAAARVEDVSREGLRVVRKGNKEALLPLAPHELEDLQAFAKRHGEPWLIPHVRQNSKLSDPPQLTRQRANVLCARIAVEARVQAFHPHDCRRTFATRLFDAHVDLGTVQRLMGHESPSTTMIYDKRVARQDAEAKGKVELWPR